MSYTRNGIGDIDFDRKALKLQEGVPLWTIYDPRRGGPHDPLRYLLSGGFSGYRGFSGITAAVDAKLSLTSMLDSNKQHWKELVSKGAVPQGAVDSIYAQLKGMQTELSKYTPWDNSYFIYRGSGDWESSSDINSGINELLQKLPSPSKIGIKVAEQTNYQTIAAKKDCKSQAISKFGPIMGRTPGMDILACHGGKIAIAGGLLIGAFILATLSPYASLATEALKRAPRSPR